ncbi:hypothetical protein BWO91_14675 [Plantibacter flavus]|nr:hypothetical protein BWO91_14675 [Plantibacter flavus]
MSHVVTPTVSRDDGCKAHQPETNATGTMRPGDRQQIPRRIRTSVLIDVNWADSSHRGLGPVFAGGSHEAVGHRHEAVVDVNGL